MAEGAGCCGAARDRPAKLHLGNGVSQSLACRLGCYHVHDHGGSGHVATHTRIQLLHTRSSLRWWHGSACPSGVIVQQKHYMYASSLAGPVQVVGAVPRPR